MSLHHLTNRRVVLVSTHSSRSAMAPPVQEGSGSDVGLGESNFWAGITDNITDGGSGLVAVDDVFLPLVKK